MTDTNNILNQLVKEGLDKTLLFTTFFNKNMTQNKQFEKELTKTFEIIGNKFENKVEPVIQKMLKTGFKVIPFVGTAAALDDMIKSGSELIKSGSDIMNDVSNLTTKMEDMSTNVTENMVMPPISDNSDKMEENK